MSVPVNSDAAAAGAHAAAGAASADEVAEGFQMHPETTPDASVLKWRYAGAVAAPAVGIIDPVPLALSQAGVEAMTSHPDALLVKIADQASWAQLGEGIRAALTRALTSSTAWSVQPLTGPEKGSTVDRPDDAAIAAAARRVIADQVGRVASSHGGGIELLDVTDGVVTVRMGGACRGCPAAGLTLHRRFETALRSAVDGVRSVEAQQGDSCDATGKPSGLLSFLGLPHDRNRRRNH